MTVYASTRDARHQKLAMELGAEWAGGTFDAPREKLMRILKQDVGRLDRLITDISNASRLDAELSREPPRPVDVARLLGEVTSLYNETARPNEPRVALVSPQAASSRRSAAPLNCKAGCRTLTAAGRRSIASAFGWALISGTPSLRAVICMVTA